MKVIKAPNDFRGQTDMSIFLAGSIEMGKAWNWQQYVEDTLADEDIVLFNPRRDDWDSSWEQTIENENFVEQVTWELDALSAADIILMYFDPNTISPISLLELGRFSATGQMMVVCPEDYFRRGNVEIFCKRYGVWFSDSLDDAVRKVVDFKNAFNKRNK